MFFKKKKKDTEKRGIRLDKIVNNIQRHKCLDNPKSVDIRKEYEE